MNPIVEIEHLSFGYGAEPVLEDISLTVKQGDILGLIGPNGSGKTTLLKLILGVLEPQRGRIRLFGQELSRFREWARIGYVRQRSWDFERNFPASVEEIVRLGRVPRLRFGRWRASRQRSCHPSAARGAYRRVTPSPHQRALWGAAAAGLPRSRLGRGAGALIAGRAHSGGRSQGRI
jgi:ABC-type Mn2+/Zn2+ transport system ATPase subunit